MVKGLLLMTNEEKIAEIVRICNIRINAQRRLESSSGYGNDDYTEGRTVGAAATARKILQIIRGKS